MTTRDPTVGQALSACRSTLAVVLLFTFCINLLALASPLYMLQIYDRVVTSRSVETLIMLSLITGFALAIMSLLDGLRRLILDRLGEWIDRRLHAPVLAGALEEGLRSGALNGGQGLRDLASLRGFVTGPALPPILDAPWAPIFLVALFALHPLLGAVGVFGCVALLALALLNEVVTRQSLATANLAANRLQHKLGAMLRNAEVVEAMDMGRGAARLLEHDAAERDRAQRRAGARAGAIIAASRCTRLLLQVLVMGTGAWVVIAEHGSAGAIFAGSFLLSRSLAPVENAIASWKSLVTARLAYRRLGDVVGEAPAARASLGLPAPRGGLRFESASYVPAGAAAPVLAQISLALQPGEILGVIGPSGAGKSSLARLATGTWTPTRGRVLLDGADVGLWIGSGGAHHLGYLPQDVELFDATIADNIARLAPADRDDIVAAARLAGTHEFIMGLPHAYDTAIGADGIKLSGGQRQRLGLARAILRSPHLVVLDEPDASLDRDGEAALVQTLLHLKSSGSMVVVVTHRLPLLENADKLLLLRAGAIDAFGAREEVLARLNAAALPRNRGAAALATARAM